MVKFKHFLFTRFNCLYYQSVDYRPHLQSKIEERAFNIDWLKYRIKLFERFTFPSVLGQTTKNFIWTIILHENTPNGIKQYFNNYQSKLIRIMFTDSLLHLKIPEYMIQNLTNQDLVISSQLDSDDALHKNFIQCVQNKINNKVEFLNFPRGCIYSTKLNKVFGRKSLNNPFQSFVEKSKKIKSIYCIEHGSSLKIAPVRQIYGDRPVWLQVIHDSNLINKIAKKRKDKGFELDRIKKEFSL